MTIPYFVLTRDQREVPLNVLGTHVTVLASNEATQSYGITFQQGSEGTGPPPHSHDWDESFYVLDGEIDFHCDGRVHACHPGTLVHVPRGTVHGFQYGKGGGRMLEITGQGALAAQMCPSASSVQPSGTSGPAGNATTGRRFVIRPASGLKSNASTRLVGESM